MTTTDNSLTLIVDNGVTRAIPVDGRRVIIQSDDTPCEIIRNNKNEIIKVEFINDKTIKIGYDLLIKYWDNECVYSIREIEQINDKQFLLYASKITKTSVYVLPMLFQTRVNAGWKYLINAYIINENKYTIGLLYRFAHTPEYKKIEVSVVNSDNFLGMREYDSFSTLFLLRVPPSFRDDFDQFLIGRYSKMSSKAKSKIKTFHRLSSDSITYQVLVKHKKLREKLEKELDVKIPSNQELGSIPLMEEEQIKLKNYYD